ncbi:MAG: undecaprenyl/decaprenyl-phosphate alpha-N-acetylglucosaminyl 1-phosphate transferase [Oscillospiraceae bacterium]|jgi:UDP-GlcNAc:undecaprenyl-phosphate GlcNAc-1-phosphate transferase|nr:undecaprenyl/decaprenyl-phosphate alpha-N-acetylglucosaminyl 1-phosphate transferase [Oscillospiraceae bacterium]
MIDIYVQMGIALVAALVICFAAMPVVRAFANKVGAIDVPRDNTRMHDYPIPRLGGLAIFLGFLFSVVLFADVDRPVRGILLGSVVIVIVGVIDDVVTLKWYVKLVFQIAAALIAVWHGIVVYTVSNPNVFSAAEFLSFGRLAAPITVLWIVGITNAVNLIDGLDGLAAGVSGISSATMFVIALLVSEVNTAIIMAALAGSCLGFLPYNFSPKKRVKMLMGDTGALMLGYVLSTVSIMGLFKFFAIISFAVPFLVIGLPLFDTALAFTRRILKGQHPMHRDRGHFHHRLVDMGLSQKQAVAVLYAISAILGLAAVVITARGEIRAIIVVVAVVFAASVGIYILGARRRGNAKSAQAETDSASASEKEDGAP